MNLEKFLTKINEEKLTSTAKNPVKNERLREIYPYTLLYFTLM